MERRAAEFEEARVLRVEPNAVRVQSSGDGRISQLRASEIYRLNRSTAHSLDHRGGYRICGQQNHLWVACRLEQTTSSLAAQESELFARNADGKQLKVKKDRILEPTDFTRLNIETLFTRAERQNAFRLELLQAGRPRAFEGWSAKPREKVIARNGQGWYSARIFEIEKHSLRVKWLRNNRVQRLAKSDVIPEPPYPARLHPGSFALMRPTARSEAWPFVKLVRVSDEMATVLTPEQEQQEVSRKDLVPLTPLDAPAPP